MNSISYGYVYITENLINHKKYIGQHIGDRFDESYKGSGINISRAINKYGFDNFKTDVLEWCDSKDDLNERERYWISFYNAVESKEFYNIARGGDGGDTISGLSGSSKEKHREKSVKNTSNLWKNEEYRSKVLGGMKKYWESEESHIASSERNVKVHNESWRNRQSLIMRGENNPMYGKHWKHSEETLEKIRQRSRGENNPMYGKPSPCRKKIACVETGEVFDSVGLAAKSINRDGSYLSHLAKRYDSGDKTAMTCGYHWSYYRGE